MESIRVGDQVLTLVDLRDPTGDRPELLVPSCTVGTVIDADPFTPTVDFGVHGILVCDLVDVMKI